MIPGEPKLLSNLQKIRQKLVGTDRDDHIDEVNEWEREAKQALLLDNLQEHAGIKIIVKKLHEDIKHIDARLMREKSDTMPDHVRDVVIDLRDFMKGFLEIFAVSKSTIKELEETVDKELSDDEDVV